MIQSMPYGIYIDEAGTWYTRETNFINCYLLENCIFLQQGILQHDNNYRKRLFEQVSTLKRITLQN